MWLTSLACNTAAFTRSFIDLFNQAEIVNQYAGIQSSSLTQRGQKESQTQAQGHISSLLGGLGVSQLQGKSNNQFKIHRQSVNIGQNMVPSSRSPYHVRTIGRQQSFRSLNFISQSSAPSSSEGPKYVPTSAAQTNLVGAPTTHGSHGCTHNDDKHSDLRKVGYKQSLFNKENEFNGELKQSISVKNEAYE